MVEIAGPSSELSPSEGEEGGFDEGGEDESAPPKREKSASIEDGGVSSMRGEEYRVADEANLWDRES